MAQHLELRQGHLVGYAHRVGPLVPLIADIPHRVADCIVNTMRDPGPILVGFVTVQWVWGLHLPSLVSGHIGKNVHTKGRKRYVQRNGSYGNRE